MRRLIWSIIWQYVSIHRISDAGPSNDALWVRILDFFIVPFLLPFILLPLLSPVASFFGTFGIEFGAQRGTVSTKVATLKYCNRLVEMYKIAQNRKFPWVFSWKFSLCYDGKITLGIQIEYHSKLALVFIVDYWYLTIRLNFWGLLRAIGIRSFFWYKVFSFGFCGILISS